jgi:hypothetical protein
MELYCTPEVNTLQLYTASNSSNTRTRPTCTVPEHSFLHDSSNRTSCGNLPTLTPILAVRKLPNTRRDNPTSGYRSTCTPQRHLGVYIINPPFTSPDDRMSSPSTVALVLWPNSPLSVEVRRLLIPYLWRCLSIVASVTLLLVCIVIHQSR